jgi:hypothetical protein
MKISVITRWLNEGFFAPYFLGHYSWADEIIVMLERATTDGSAEVVSKFPNARIVWTETGGVVNDRVFSDMMSDLAAGLDSDWVIRADGDELIFPKGFGDSRAALAEASGNVVVVLFHWIYRHGTDAELDPAKPAVLQRRHGGAYTIWPGMGPTFTKPSIVRPGARIRWRPGEQGYLPDPGIKISDTRFEGSHWQMVAVEEAVRRLLSAEKRLSAENVRNKWGTRGFTEAMIRAECAAHLGDPRVI